jgi:hypothetical protein
MRLGPCEAPLRRTISLGGYSVGDAKNFPVTAAVLPQDVMTHATLVATTGPR